jgi:hypothetical protein
MDAADAASEAAADPDAAAVVDAVPRAIVVWAPPSSPAAGGALVIGRAERRIRSSCMWESSKCSCTQGRVLAALSSLAQTDPSLTKSIAPLMATPTRGRLGGGSLGF